MPGPFHSIYTHKFIRAAVCVPHVRVADPGFNVGRTLGLGPLNEITRWLHPTSRRGK